MSLADPIVPKVPAPHTMHIREQCVYAVCNIQTYLARNTVCVYSKDQVINAVGNQSVVWNTSIQQVAPWRIALSLQPVVLRAVLG